MTIRWAQAACVGLTPLWEEPDHGGRESYQVQYAKRECRECPTLLDCFGWVMGEETEPCKHMVVAGMTTAERVKLRRQLREDAASDQRLDDVAAYPVR